MLCLNKEIEKYKRFKRELFNIRLKHHKQLKEFSIFLKKFINKKL